VIKSIDRADKRRHVRIGIKVPLKYRPLDSNQLGYKSVQVTNFSEGGLCFLGEESLPRHGHLMLEFTLPTEGEQTQIVGEVARTDKHGSGYFEIGIKFHRLLTEEKNSLLYL
jgi:c-di-GMP-binding flagellar brake protein YcgR